MSCVDSLSYSTFIKQAGYDSVNFARQCVSRVCPCPALLLAARRGDVAQWEGVRLSRRQRSLSPVRGSRVIQNNGQLPFLETTDS